MNFKHIIFLPLILLSLSACRTTNLVESWVDPTYQAPPLKKILVIGIIKNQKNRYKFEDEFAKLITTESRTGIASYTLLADLEKSGTKENVLKIIEETGADGVMIVTTHGLISMQRTTPGSYDYVGGGNGMYGYYNSSYAVIYNQGHTITDTLLRIDTKLFNAASEKIIWSGKTESFNPESAMEVINDLERLVIRDMRKSGVIQ